MPVARIPLAGSLVNRNADPANYIGKDQVFQNCYPEIIRNSVSGKTTAYVYKRLGTTTNILSQGLLSTVSIPSYGYTPVAGSPGSSSFAFSFQDGSFANSKSTAVFLNNGSLIGSSPVLATSCSYLSEAQVSNTTYIVGNFQTSTGPQAWYSSLTASTWTRITSATFPTSTMTGPIVQMDGFVFVMDTTGTIWNSDLNSLDNWTATSFIAAQATADGGIAVQRHRNVIVAFGPSSIEFFHNAGNAFGSPLENIPGQQRRIGAYRQVITSGAQTRTTRPFVKAFDTIYWVGINADTGKVGIYRLNGYEPEKISTPTIDKLIQAIPAASTSSFVEAIGAFQAHSMGHVAFRIGLTTWCYCADTGVWWQMILPGLAVNPISISGNYFSTIGSVVSFSPSVYTDNTSTIPVTMRLQNMDFGTMKRKSWKRLWAVGDIQTSTSRIGVSYSDDDYGSFSSSRNIDMSLATDLAQGLSRLGASRRRAWQLTHSDPTPLRLEAIEVEYKIVS